MPVFNTLTLLSLAPAIGRDLQDHIVHWGSGAQSLYGYSEEETLGKVSHEVLRTILPLPLEQIKTALLEKDRWKGELVHTCKDGSCVTVLSEWSLLRDSNNTPCAILETNQDLSEHKRTEETRHKEYEEQLRIQSAALHSAANAIAITRRSGQIQWVNPAFTELTGYTAEEATGQTPRLLKSDAESPQLYKDMWETILAGRVWRGELINRRKDGSLYTEDMTVTPVRDAKGEITQFIAIKQDVTERRKSEQALRRHNHRLSVLNIAAQTLLSASDPNTALEAIYDRMAEYFQVDGFVEFRLRPSGTELELVASKEVAGARPPSIKRLALGQGIAGQVAQTRKSMAVANAQTSDRPDLKYVKELRAEAYACEPLIVGDRLLGTLSFASASRASFDPEDLEFFQTLANYVALAREQVRLAETLKMHASNLEKTVAEKTSQLLEANANLQTFAHSAAHDLRSPLRSIGAFTEMTLQEYGPQLGPDGQSYLQRVLQSVNQMNQLLHDLLDYSKLSHAELQHCRVELSSAMKEALSLLQEEIRSKMAEVSVQSPLPCILGHPATVVLVITNLVSNALKFIATGVQPKVRVWTEPRGALVRVYVEDNGIGIAQTDQEKLFKLFHRLHGKSTYPGTGLGLALVHRAVERMHGTVGVESEKGKGSKFWVELQAADNSAGAGRGAVNSEKSVI